MEDLKMTSLNILSPYSGGDLSMNSLRVFINCESEVLEQLLLEHCSVRAMESEDEAYSGCKMEHNELVNGI